MTVSMFFPLLAKLKHYFEYNSKDKEKLETELKERQWNRRQTLAISEKRVSKEEQRTMKS